MRKMLVVLALLLPFSTEAQEKADTAASSDTVTVAEYALRYQYYRANSVGTQRVFGEGWEYFLNSERCGHWEFGYGEYRYLEGVFGVFCDIHPLISVGIAYGAEVEVGDERTAAFGRGATTLTLGTEKTNLDLYYENGSSKYPWLRAELQLFSTRHFALGGIYQTDDGLGPKVRLALPVTSRTDLRVWGAPVWNQGRANLLVGAELVMSLRSAK